MMMEEKGNSRSESLEDDNVMTVIRYPHTQADVDKIYRKKDANRTTVPQMIRSKCTCSAKNVGKYLLSLVPIVTVVRTYKMQFVLGDLLSGVSAACLHFPQGLAFGLLASLAPSYGLYTSFFPVLFYLIFGSSQHISIGTKCRHCALHIRTRQRKRARSHFAYKQQYDCQYVLNWRHINR